MVMGSIVVGRLKWKLESESVNQRIFLADHTLRASSSTSTTIGSIGGLFAEILALHFFYKVGKLIDFYVMTTVQEQTLNNCTMHNGGVVVEQQIITSYSNPTPTRLCPSEARRSAAADISVQW